MKPYPFQLEDLAKLRANNYTGLIATEAGGGKGHPLDEPVLTPTGWVSVGDIRVGDSVLGSNGEPTVVTAIYDRGFLPIYRVTFRDGSTVRVDGEHLWSVRYGNGKTAVMQTDHLVTVKHSTRGKYSIPSTRVNHPEKVLPLPPYVLGSLLADGYLHGTGVQWTKAETSVVEEFIREASSVGIPVTTRSPSIRHGVLGITGTLRDMGLRVRSAEKFIPVEYLISSFEQRLALLNGLFDGDGGVRKGRGTAEYSTVSEQLSDDVLQLLWSMGLGATKRRKKHRRSDYWIVTIHSNFDPFRAASHPTVTGSKRPLKRAFASIEPEGVEPVRCISVSAEDHLYVTKDYIVTHNTATAVLALMEAKPAVTLIVAPKSTHHTAWSPTLRENASVEARIIGNAGKQAQAALFDFEMGYPGVYLASPQFVTRADVSNWRGDMLIVDEIHQGAATPNSKLQRKLSGGIAKGEPLNVRFPMRLALSGTPMRGSFSNMWGVMRFLWGDTLNGRTDVAASNFILWQGYRMDWEEVYTAQRNPDGSPKKVRKYLSESVPGKLISEAPCVIVHKRRETCCRHHPGGFLSTEAPQVVERVYELTAKQRKAIGEMDRMMMTWIEDNPLEARIPLTQRQRIRQLTLAEARVDFVPTADGERSTVNYDPDCVSPVVDEIIHILSNLPDGEPVVVYGESQRFVEVLTYRLNKAGFRAEEYSGVRKAILSDFGKTYQVLVGVVSAIGTGTNGLQERCSTEIFAEQPLSLTMLDQASARLDRIDSSRRVQRFVLLDDLGVQAGRMEELWLQRLSIENSMRARV